MTLRHGFTMIETVIVIVLLGALVLIGYPRLSAGMTRSNVNSARTAMVNVVAKARLVASQSARRTWVKFDGNRAYVIARPRTAPTGSGDADTVGSIVNFAQAYGVTVTRPSDVDSILFTPAGIGSGFAAPVTITLSHDGYSNAVHLDYLGRVTK